MNASVKCDRHDLSNSNSRLSKESHLKIALESNQPFMGAHNALRGPSRTRGKAEIGISPWLGWCHVYLLGLEKRIC